MFRNSKYIGSTGSNTQNDIILSFFFISFLSLLVSLSNFELLHFLSNPDPFLFVFLKHTEGKKKEMRRKEIEEENEKATQRRMLLGFHLCWLAITAHLFPYILCAANNLFSSSSLKSLLFFLGSNWLNHLNLQLFPITTKINK